MTDVWVHNLDPFLVQFTPGVGIRWYGLAYMTGFILGAYLITWLAGRGRRTLPAEQVTDFMTYIVLGTMLGGRIGYVLFYSPDLLTQTSPLNIFGMQLHIWSALAVWEGGMASHGGIAGIVIASVLYAWRHKLNWMHLGDLTTLGGTIGIFFGRLANFINGELMGRETSAQLPWAVKFPQDMYRWLSHEPDQLIKLKDTAALVGVSGEQWQQWASERTGMAHQAMSGVVEKILLAIQDGNEAVRNAIGMVLAPRHPSQLYEAGLEGLFLFIVLFLAWKKPRKPGVIGGIFLTLYAVVRIIGEQFRMPDAHIGFQLFGLTRGQWISFGQLALSAGLLIYAWRRPADVISGWGPEAQALRAQDASGSAANAKTSQGARGKGRKRHKGSPRET